jgi:hypothetical protein
MVIHVGLLQSWVILAVFWVARPQNPLSTRPKDIFCVNFGQEGHLPTQHPGFGAKLSSKGKPGTSALLETLRSPVNFFQRKAFKTTVQVLYSAYIFL